MLAADGPHPFPPRNDEAVDDDNTDEPSNGDAEDAESKTVEVRIDFDGLAGRVARVPMEADNLAGLHVTAEHILYARTPPFVYGRDAATKTVLMAYSKKDRESFAIAEDVEAYSSSADGKHVVVQQASAFKRYAVKKGEQEADAISLAEFETQRILSAEWAAMFDEAW